MYESSTGNRPMSDLPRFLERNPIPTLVLYGPEDHVVPASFPDRCRVAFTECIGPFEVAGARATSCSGRPPTPSTARSTHFFL